MIYTSACQVNSPGWINRHERPDVSAPYTIYDSMIAYRHGLHLLSKAKGGDMAASGGCELAVGRGCCWIATMGSAQTIYGIGKTERQAIRNAMKQIGGNGFTPVMFECMPCTAALYRAFRQHGAAGLNWEIDEYGVASLVHTNGL